MKKELIIASAALMLGTFACKKIETTPPLQQQGVEVNVTEPLNEVKQKMFTLSADETTDYIKYLKTQFVLNTAQQKGVQNHYTISLDSSLWQIEALLNYDFDNANNPVPNGGDSLKFDIAIINENKVSKTEITNAYIYFSNHLNAHLAINPSDRVKLIDVTATESNNTLHLKADVIYTTDNSADRVATDPCDPITTQGHWSGGSGGFGYICTAIPTTQRGPNMCNKRLNCAAYICSNGFHPSYTNVVTVTIGTNDGTSNPFYYYYGLTGSAPCNTEYLTASLLNYNVSLAQSYAVSNLPTSPSGMVRTNFTFYNMPGYPITGNYSIMAGYWLLRITYAVPSCSGGQSS